MNSIMKVIVILLAGFLGAALCSPAPGVGGSEPTSENLPSPAALKSDAAPGAVPGDMDTASTFLWGYPGFYGGLGYGAYGGYGYPGYGYGAYRYPYYWG